MELALLVLRVVVGALFMGHDAQKALGWFGGHGPQGTGSFLESIGVRPGHAMAIAAGTAELVGGLLLALGLLVPAAAAMLIAVMVVAVWTVHRSKGLWISDGGFEYNVVLVAVLFAVTAAGPGAWSLDAVWNTGLAGEDWALAALAAGALGAWAALAAAHLAGRRTSRRDRTAAPAGA